MIWREILTVALETVALLAILGGVGFGMLAVAVLAGVPL